MPKEETPSTCFLFLLLQKSRELMIRRIALQHARTPLVGSVRISSLRQSIRNVHDEAQQRRQRLYQRALSKIPSAIGFLLFVHVFSTYFYTYGFTVGISMMPSMPSDFRMIIISKYYRRGRELRVGDVVSFKHPLSSDTTAVKRIIGMPGDFVLRDSPLDIEEMGHFGPEDVEPGKRVPVMIQVPLGHCYVVGDNYKHSRDSRHFGPLPLNLIYGKVVVMFDRWTPLPWFRRVENTLQEATWDD